MREPLRPPRSGHARDEIDLVRDRVVDVLREELAGRRRRARSSRRSGGSRRETATDAASGIAQSGQTSAPCARTWAPSRRRRRRRRPGPVDAPGANVGLARVAGVRWELEAQCGLARSPLAPRLAGAFHIDWSVGSFRDRGGEEMSYFVTGATGFIGRNLVELLLEREGTIYVLVREGSKGRLEELRNRWGVDQDRVVGIVGDLSQPGLGISDEDVERLRGEVDHLFHLAAIYDMTADAESQRRRQRRGNPPHGPVRRGRRGRARAHGQLDRRRRPLQGHLAGGHVRGGRGPRQPSLLPDQARLRGRSSARSARGPGASTGPASSSATPRPARWTRSTARTTSSS